MNKAEKHIHTNICKFLDLQYPSVIYLSDPSGLRVSIGIAKELKAKRCKRYKIPDLTILHPANGWHGLVLEIKVSVDDVFKKDGSMKKNEHVTQQFKTLTQLVTLGYKAVFACGFDHAIKIINEYFKTKK